MDRDEQRGRRGAARRQALTESVEVADASDMLGAAAPFAQADFLVVEAFKTVLAHGCLSVPAAVGIGAYHDKTLGSPR